MEIRINTLKSSLVDEMHRYSNKYRMIIVLQLSNVYEPEKQKKPYREHKMTYLKNYEASLVTLVPCFKRFITPLKITPKIDLIYPTLKTLHIK